MPLLVPVVRLVFLFTALVQQNCTVLYCSTDLLSVFFSSFFFLYRTSP